MYHYVSFKNPAWTGHNITARYTSPKHCLADSPHAVLPSGTQRNLPSVFPFSRAGFCTTSNWFLKKKGNCVFLKSASNRFDNLWPYISPSAVRRVCQIPGFIGCLLTLPRGRGYSRTSNSQHIIVTGRSEGDHFCAAPRERDYLVFTSHELAVRQPLSSPLIWWRYF